MHALHAIVLSLALFRLFFSQPWFSHPWRPFKNTGVVQRDCLRAPSRGSECIRGAPGEPIGSKKERKDEGTLAALHPFSFSSALSPFTMACSTLLSILSLCLLASRVVGQTQEFTAEIEAAAARFIRIPLAPLMPGIPLSPSNTTQTILRLREKGLPSAPGLLSLEGESLAGVAPPLLRPLRLEITVAYRESGMLQVARLSLNLTINTQQGARLSTERDGVDWMHRWSGWRDGGVVGE